MPIASGLIRLIGRSLKKSSARAKNAWELYFPLWKKRFRVCGSSKALMRKRPQREKFHLENEAFTKQMVSTYRKVDLASPMSELLEQ